MQKASSIQDTRSLRDLSGIGKSIERNLQDLGVSSVSELARRDGDELYHALCDKTGSRQDPCVLDTFRCAVAQARNPDLPTEQRNWWWWSQQRKAAGANRVERSGSFTSEDVHPILFPGRRPKTRSLDELTEGIREHNRKRPSGV